MGGSQTFEMCGYECREGGYIKNLAYIDDLRSHRLYDAGSSMRFTARRSHNITYI